MNNKITIDIDEILKMPDNSITGSKTIIQIALVSIHDKTISNKNIDALLKKPKKEFSFCGLYPEPMKIYNIKPEYKQHGNK